MNVPRGVSHFELYPGVRRPWHAGPRRTGGQVASFPCRISITLSPTAPLALFRSEQNLSGFTLSDRSCSVAATSAGRGLVALHDFVLGVQPKFANGNSDCLILALALGQKLDAARDEKYMCRRSWHSTDTFCSQVPALVQPGTNRSGLSLVDRANDPVPAHVSTGCVLLFLDGAVPEQAYGQASRSGQHEADRRGRTVDLAPIFFAECQLIGFCFHASFRQNRKPRTGQ